MIISTLGRAYLIRKNDTSYKFSEKGLFKKNLCSMGYSEADENEFEDSEWQELETFIRKDKTRHLRYNQYVNLS